jgi:hypothetical protein
MQFLMSDNDDEIRLRDQFAIAAMQALITKIGVWESYIIDAEGLGPKEATAERTKRIAAVSYRIADEMRKARLQSFT